MILQIDLVDCLTSQLKRYIHKNGSVEILKIYMFVVIP